ncbi:hypothetical protein K2224_13410 [Streptomyces sp. BHT-5-2]|uniref:hypothetical protein n=1 Tax=unclassified Streptomyces TaxID=2593676 RepID=UPI001C8EE0E4|nr:hypothetical protein [Streptomyces sp. BHT-5-2]QZL04070.1 hypothetical protein K2224_13410 [Streptomyces sp. BHT-5-2]
MANNSMQDEEDRDEPPDHRGPEEEDRGKTWVTWVQLACDTIVALSAVWGVFHGNGG